MATAGPKQVSTLAGLFLAVETKKPGGKLRHEQQVFLEAVRNAGGVALCVESVGELDDALKRLGIGE